VLQQIEFRLSPIRNYKPEIYEPLEYDAVNKKFGEIKKLKMTDPIAAERETKLLGKRVDALVVKVQSAHAAALALKAEEALRDMDKVDANVSEFSSPQRAQEIRDLRDSAQRHFVGKRWDEAIRQFDDVVHNVEMFLLPWKQSAQTNLNELQSARRQMDEFRVNPIEPECVQEVERIIADVRQFMAQRDYLQAKALAESGLEIARQGIAKANNSFALRSP
jgi:hypothetical protein